MKNKEELRKNYEDACNDYVKALGELWELDVEYYGSWVGDDVGGVFDYGDGMFSINMKDIALCVDNDIKMQEYSEYMEYCARVAFLWPDESLPNFTSWHKGCPRYSEETLERLEGMRRDFEKSLEDAPKSLF